MQWKSVINCSLDSGEWADAVAWLGAYSFCDFFTRLPEIRESRAWHAVETIVLYPLKCTTPLSVTPQAYHLTLQGSMGLIVGHLPNIYTKFTKIDSLKVTIVHMLVIIAAVTQIHGTRQKSRYKAKITVIMAIVNSWFTYIPAHLQHLAILCYINILNNSNNNKIYDCQFCSWLQSPLFRRKIVSCFSSILCTGCIVFERLELLEWWMLGDTLVPVCCRAWHVLVAPNSARWFLRTTLDQFLALRSAASGSSECRWEMVWHCFP